MFDTTTSTTTNGQFDEYNRLLEQAREDVSTAQRLLATRTDERDQAKLALKLLKESLQSDLAEWAENWQDSGDTSYQELHELMVDNGLEGLKRKFIVTVRATYEFEVEVEATDEDAARDEVDNDLAQHCSDNIYLGSDPDDYDLEANEA